MPRLFGRARKTALVATAFATVLVPCTGVVGLFVFAETMPRAVARSELGDRSDRVHDRRQQHLTSAVRR